MNRIQRLLTFAGIIGFLNGISGWEDFLFGKKHETIIKEMEDRLIELMRSYKMTEKESIEMYKKVANMEFGCFPKHDIEARTRKGQVALTQDTLDTIAEHAINHSCKDCKRNISKCSLRRALKKADIVCYDSEGKCEYMFS